MYDRNQHNIVGKLLSNPKNYIKFVLSHSLLFTVQETMNDTRECIGPENLSPERNAFGILNL